jgi:hypothetical protein
MTFSKMTLIMMTLYAYTKCRYAESLLCCVTNKSIMAEGHYAECLMLNVNGSGKQYGLLHHNNYDRKRF